MSDELAGEGEQPAPATEAEPPVTEPEPPAAAPPSAAATSAGTGSMSATRAWWGCDTIGNGTTQPFVPGRSTFAIGDAGMSRAFGCKGHSTFDITLSNGFDMQADSMRTTRMLARASTNPSGSRCVEYDGSRGRGMTEDGLFALAEALNTTSTNIEELSLRSMDISDSACTELARALQQNWTLKRLEFHANRMSAHACGVLVGALKCHRKLAILQQGGGPVRQGTIPKHVYAKTLLNAFRITKSVRLVETSFF